MQFELQGKDAKGMSLELHLAHCGFDRATEFIAAVCQWSGVPDHQIVRYQRMYEGSHMPVIPQVVQRWLDEWTPAQSVRLLRKRNPMLKHIIFAVPAPVAMAA